MCVCVCVRVRVHVSVRACVCLGGWGQKKTGSTYANTYSVLDNSVQIGCLGIANLNYKNIYKI